MIVLVAGILIIKMPAFATPIFLLAVASFMLAFLLFRQKLLKPPRNWPVIVIYVLGILAGIFLALDFMFETEKPALSRTFHSFYQVTKGLFLVCSIVVAWIYSKRKKVADNRKDSV